MTTMSDATRSKKPRAPVEVIIIPSSAFADDWQGKPDGEIAVGVRLVAESDMEDASIEASRHCMRVFEGGPHTANVDEDTYNDVFNSRIMGEGIARAMCDPNDVTMDHPAITSPVDLVPIAFTPAGIRYAWDLIARAMVKCSPIVPVASADQLRLLAVHIQRGSFARLNAEDRRSLGKLAAFMLEKLDEAAADVGEAMAELEDQEAEDDENGEGEIASYKVTAHSAR